MIPSATSSKSLSLKEVVVGVLESDYEDGLSSFEEPKEEIGTLKEFWHKRNFFSFNIPTPFPDPVDRGIFVDYENSESEDDRVGIIFSNPGVYLNNVWFQQLNLAIIYSSIFRWEYVREALWRTIRLREFVHDQY